MKKIFALAISIILLITILIPAVSSNNLLPDTSSNYTELNPLSLISLSNASENPINIEKTIKDGENWVNTYNANSEEIIRFRIKVTYHDWNTDPNITECMLNNITIIDRFPAGLVYLGNSNYNENTISLNQHFIMWIFNDIILLDNESLIIEYDAIGNNNGEFIDYADIAAYESCNAQYFCNTAHAKVVISSNNNNSSNNTKYLDVDDDTYDEEAIDQNNDTSDGYEVFVDPDNSSESIKSIDGDNDNKIDHFIDINKDQIPERYWDPDEDILTDINLIDVDYDQTIEWVYDSDNDFDGKPDKYYDPDDNQIHDYIVYELTIDKIGNGQVQKEPNGILFLKNFNVKLTAVADPGWKFVSYSGDITSSNNIITVTMDEDKNIIALFVNKINVNITKPLNNYMYIFSLGFESTEFQPHIIGPINVKAQVDSDNEINKVEFYINNELKKIDDSAPYSWIWFLKPSGDEENYTIIVKAYDSQGYTNSNSIKVTRSQFNPIRNHKLLSLTVGLTALSLILLFGRKGSESTVVPVEPKDNDTYNINRPPVIDIGGPYIGKIGEPIYFDASQSYDPDGDLLSFTWDFGDGSMGYNAKLSHTYEKTGKYLVKLTITDSEGNYDTETIEVEITDGSKTNGIGEDNWFWYIVAGLALTITIALGLLYVGGKRYE